MEVLLEHFLLNSDKKKHKQKKILKTFRQQTSFRNDQKYQKEQFKIQ